MKHILDGNSPIDRIKNNTFLKEIKRIEPFEDIPQCKNCGCYREECVCLDEFYDE